MIYCGITGHTGNLGKKFQKIANNIKYLLTAHHRDDQIENFFIR